MDFFYFVRKGKKLVIKERKYSMLLRSYNTKIYDFYCDQTKAKMISYVSIYLKENLPLMIPFDVRGKIEDFRNCS